MSITPAFYLHGTPHPVHRSEEQKIVPKRGRPTFTTDDLNYARCYTIKDQNCMATLWNNGQWHIILIKEPEDFDRPGYIYQIPTHGIDFQKHTTAEFTTTESHPVTGPNAIVHGIRELIERHDVQIYIMPKDADPEIFTKSLDYPSFVTMQGYLCALGYRHINVEWQKTSSKKTKLDPTL